jgi:hypothetical protein
MKWARGHNDEREASHAEAYERSPLAANVCGVKVGPVTCSRNQVDRSGG